MNIDMKKNLSWFSKTVLSTSLLGLVACQSLPSVQTPIRLEAEIDYKNGPQNHFQTEEAEFYSGGAAIMITGRVPVGGTGTVSYDLQNRVPPGTYSLTVSYNDENDGHSPVEINLDGQKFSFTMDAETPTAFADVRNQRRARFDNVQVKQNSVLKIRGTVDRYNSEHKELVRIDYFEFLPKKDDKL